MIFFLDYFSLVFLDYFDLLMSKINFLKRKNILF
jgi:hypothetical protein